MHCLKRGPGGRKIKFKIIKKFPYNFSQNRFCMFPDFHSFFSQQNLLNLSQKEMIRNQKYNFNKMLSIFAKFHGKTEFLYDKLFSKEMIQKLIGSINNKKS